MCGRWYLSQFVIRSRMLFVALLKWGYIYKPYCAVWFGLFFICNRFAVYQRATLSVWFSGDVIDSHGIGLCLSDSWLDASTTHQPPPHAGAGNSSCFAASSPVRVPYVPLPRRRHTSVSESRWMQGMPNATWERLVFFFSFATERLVFLCDSMTGVKPNKVSNRLNCLRLQCFLLPLPIPFASSNQTAPESECSSNSPIFKKPNIYLPL